MQTRDRDWILRHIGSPEAIYAKVPDFEQKYADYHLGAEQISANIDGSHSLEEIAQSIGIDTFEVCKTVAALQVLELARPQPFKPTQMPLSVSEMQEPQTADIDSPEAIEDVSLGQVMHVPTVEELSDQQAEEPYIAQSYSEPVEERLIWTKLYRVLEGEEATEFSPFRQLNDTDAGGRRSIRFGIRRGGRGT